MDLKVELPRLKKIIRRRESRGTGKSYMNLSRKEGDHNIYLRFVTDPSKMLHF